MSELSKLLDQYLDRIRTLGAPVADALQPGATGRELAEAEAAFGTSLHPDLHEWFRWSNGFARDQARDPDNLEELFFPWGQQMSLSDVLSRDSVWAYAERMWRTESAAEGTDLMHRNGFAVMARLGVEISVECDPGPGFGAVWAHEIDNGAFVMDEHLSRFVERAIRFAERGWLVVNPHGGVSVADRELLSAGVPPEVQAAAGGPRWMYQADSWGFDPFTDR